MRCGAKVNDNGIKIGGNTCLQQNMKRTDNQNETGTEREIRRYIRGRKVNKGAYINKGKINKLRNVNKGNVNKRRQIQKSNWRKGK